MCFRSGYASCAFRVSDFQTAVTITNSVEEEKGVEDEEDIRKPAFELGGNYDAFEKAEKLIPFTFRLSDAHKARHS